MKIYYSSVQCTSRVVYVSLLVQLRRARLEFIAGSGCRDVLHDLGGRLVRALRGERSPLRVGVQAAAELGWLLAEVGRVVRLLLDCISRSRRGVGWRKGARSRVRLTAGCGWIENDCSWSPEPPMISLFWLFPGIVGG
jgi:hypothetical protein